MPSSIQYGKQFENDFKKSALKDNVYIERLKDHGFIGNDNGMRFTPSNDYDFEMLYKGIVFKLEMKSVAGKSLSMNEKNVKQLNRLLKVYELLNKCGVKSKCGYIINFRELDKVVYIDADQILNILNYKGKKSINYNDVYEYTNVNSEIKFTMARLRPKYSIKDFCENFYQEFRSKKNA